MYSTITVKQVLHEKGNGFFGIGPRASAYEALEMMADKNVGALLVIHEGRLIGIFSERDYARKVILKGKSSKSTTVEELMSRSPVTVAPDAALHDCMSLMTQHRVRHLPVMRDNVLVGVLSIGDVVKAIMAEQEEAIEDLENYIAGGEYKEATEKTVPA